jgi:hypothetical protein
VDQQVRPAGLETGTVEIIVYIMDKLDEQRRNDLVSALNGNAGIVAAEFCPLRYHLLLVRYNRDSYSSHDVLDRIMSQNVNARLVGPV